MNESLVYLGYIGMILFFGILTTIFSKKMKIPNILFLIVLGIILGQVHYKGAPLVAFPEVFIVSIGILALVMIVFDSTSRFKLKEFDQDSMPAIELTGIFLIMSMIFLTLATHYLYDVPILIALLFSALMAGTAPDVVLTLLQGMKHKALQFLEVEAIINTPLIVILPFIIIEFALTGISSESITTQFIDQILPFLQQIVAGIGVGILVGIIIFKVMRKQYSTLLSPLSIIVAALLTYVMAEALEGSGVLAVTTLGLFFGSVYVKHKGELQEFSSFFSYALEILVFVLIGLLIRVSFTAQFFVYSIGLFILMVIIRYFSILMAFRGQFSLRERLFMTLNAPKGIAVASVTFLLTTFQAQIPDITKITDLTLAFILYSIIVSSIVARYSKYFIHKDIMK
ncbi:MAG: cation:proton antiporter [Nanoarchaeota archaeon]|nr:cation:proton antiporter [Nanoarchaeota archaeon]